MYSTRISLHILNCKNSAVFEDLDAWSQYAFGTMPLINQLRGPHAVWGPRISMDFDLSTAWPSGSFGGPESAGPESARWESTGPECLM